MNQTNQPQRLYTKAALKAKKGPNKTLLVLVGPDEAIQTTVEVLGSQVKRVIKTTDLVMPAIKKALNNNFVSEFQQPIELGAHHVRHYFANLDLGIHAVSNYIGKRLATRQEAIEYFTNHIGAIAFGKHWLLEELIKSFGKEKEGLFLVTNLNLEQAQRLKPALTGSLQIVYFGDDATVQADVKVAPPFNKSTIRRITNQVLKNPEPVQKDNTQGEANERTAN